MKDINLYIVEKFKISKDINPDKDFFILGEPLVKFYIYWGDSQIDWNLDNYLIYFNKVDGNSIYYNYSKDAHLLNNVRPNEEEGKKLFINSEGYCQLDMDDDLTYYIYLNKNQALDFLEKIKKIYNKNIGKDSFNNDSKELITSYFDKKTEPLSTKLYFKYLKSYSDLGDNINKLLKVLKD